MKTITKKPKTVFIVSTAYRELEVFKSLRSIYEHYSLKGSLSYQTLCRRMKHDPPVRIPNNGIYSIVEKEVK